MTRTSIGMLVGAGVVLAAACGGGGTTSSSTTGEATSSTSGDTTTGATTSTGATTTTSTGATTTTTSTGATTSSGTGGMGGAGGMGGTGGAGGKAAAGVGEPCAKDGDCTSKTCLDEKTTGWPGGACAGSCDPMTPVCQGTGSCVDDGSGMGTGNCLKTCTMGGNQCSAAYTCADINGDGSVYACVPACATNAQCPVVGTCDPKQGLCIAPETDCTNGKDDDGDGFIDCEDPTACQGSPACKPGATDTGHPCTVSTDCKATGGDPFCFDEATQGFPKGSCSEFCNLMQNDCTTVGALCVDAQLASGNGLCFLGCKTVADCPTAGYKCDMSGGQMVCLPNCTLDSQCAMFCNSDLGLCSSMDENCTNGLDDDGDGKIDCEDLDCAATCGAQVTAACMSPPVAIASNAADTTAGTNLFAGSCTGSGSHEKVFAYTPGVAGDFGLLTLNLSSATDQGIYVRTTCSDTNTELGCTDANPGGTDENIVLEVTGGQPLSLFVDGYMPGNEGAFTLTTAYTSFAPICMTATPAVLGANAGDTTGLSKVFEGSCDSDRAGEEKLFSFTPAKSGMLHLVLSSASDQGVYVRTTCGNTKSEIGCADANPGGMDEVLDVAVVMGKPLTIVVDGYQAMDAGPFTLTLTLP